MLPYSTILFDADDTLLDFHKAERLAVRQVLREFDLPVTATARSTPRSGARLNAARSPRKNSKTSATAACSKNSASTARPSPARSTTGIWNALQNTAI